jgi:hypothetical protein
MKLKKKTNILVEASGLFIAAFNNYLCYCFQDKVDKTVSKLRFLIYLFDYHNNESTINDQSIMMFLFEKSIWLKIKRTRRTMLFAALVE